MCFLLIITFQIICYNFTIYATKLLRLNTNKIHIKFNNKLYSKSSSCILYSTLLYYVTTSIRIVLIHISLSLFLSPFPVFSPLTSILRSFPFLLLLLLLLLDPFDNIFLHNDFVGRLRPYPFFIVHCCMIVCTTILLNLLCPFDFLRLIT